MGPMGLMRPIASGSGDLIVGALCMVVSGSLFLLAMALPTKEERGT
jgi:hypothetical protein